MLAMLQSSQEFSKRKRWQTRRLTGSSKAREESQIWGLVQEKEPLTLKTWGSSLDARIFFVDPIPIPLAAVLSPTL